MGEVLSVLGQGIEQLRAELAQRLADFEVQQREESRRAKQRLKTSQSRHIDHEKRAEMLNLRMDVLDQAAAAGYDMRANTSACTDSLCPSLQGCGSSMPSMGTRVAVLADEPPLTTTAAVTSRALQQLELLEARWASPRFGRSGGTAVAHPATGGRLCLPEGKNLSPARQATGGFSPSAEERGNMAGALQQTSAASPLPTLTRCHTAPSSLTPLSHDVSALLLPISLAAASESPHAWTKAQSQAAVRAAMPATPVPLSQEATVTEARGFMQNNIGYRPTTPPPSSSPRCGLTTSPLSILAPSITAAHVDRHQLQCNGIAATVALPQH